MRVHVRVRKTLVRRIEGVEEVVVEAPSVETALTHLAAMHPGVGDALLLDGGALHPDTAIYRLRRGTRALVGPGAAPTEGEVLVEGSRADSPPGGTRQRT